MKKITTIGLSALTVAALLTLAACGGGGDSGSSQPAGNNDSGSGNNGNNGNGGAQTTPPGTVSTPQYDAGSVQLAVLNQLNQYRSQCGFPTLQQNTLLDRASQAHSQYMDVNAVVSDDEDATKSGFTGATYADRASRVGFAAANSTGGVSIGYYTNSSLTTDQYAQHLISGWLAGVYHVDVASLPVNVAGIGVTSTPYNSFPNIHAALSLANFVPLTGAAPLTFPCEGVSGIPSKGVSEIPTPPNTSGAWGTPVSIIGSVSDKVLLKSGTMTDASGGVINLQLLDSSNDPNKVLKSYMAVAYSASALTPNMSYSVALTGTINGTAFSRTFTFKTGQ
ncbi:CAP domain-containing protein [Burkholderia sp. LS-044]|uniref:CAP domain-containing protein n=1 Tax=Burkholderia sp. LS-044 TaxID=1459967 RepID=UPI0010A5E0F1|nr:CAP domain-containing protein [Burkholderia sp. LS-044]THJ48952.1 CAP domain-containing protein [Burkholderia sp. LS-044]